jgi:NADP-dependent 3-hydroxy acid dehydrogenase YdfG
MLDELADNVAIVTGASSGIGEATGRALAEAGAKVVLTARRRDRLEKLAAEIQAAGGNALAVPADITNRSAVSAVADRTMDAHGRIDILINNAGVMPLVQVTS